MHELAVTQGLLNMAEDALKRYHATKISQINIVMGELSTYVPECVQDYFAMLSEDTPIAGCKLTFKIEESKAHCLKCGREFRPGPVNTACPACGSPQTEITAGKDIYIENMEIETED